MRCTGSRGQRLNFVFSREATAAGTKAGTSPPMPAPWRTKVAVIGARSPKRERKWCEAAEPWPRSCRPSASRSQDRFRLATPRMRSVAPALGRIHDRVVEVTQSSLQEALCRDGLEGLADHRQTIFGRKDGALPRVHRWQRPAYRPAPRRGAPVEMAVGHRVEGNRVARCRHAPVWPMNRQSKTRPWPGPAAVRAPTRRHVNNSAQGVNPGSRSRVSFKYGPDGPGRSSRGPAMLKTASAVAAAARYCSRHCRDARLCHPGGRLRCPSLAQRADRLDIRPIGKDCSQKAWPYFENGCLRNATIAQCRSSRLASSQLTAANSFYLQSLAEHLSSEMKAGPAMPHRPAPPSPKLPEPKKPPRPDQRGGFPCALSQRSIRLDKQSRAGHCCGGFATATGGRSSPA